MSRDARSSLTDGTELKKTLNPLRTAHVSYFLEDPYSTMLLLLVFRLSKLASIASNPREVMSWRKCVSRVDKSTIDGLDYISIHGRLKVKPRLTSQIQRSFTMRLRVENNRED
jgi:hypothetical protein